MIYSNRLLIQKKKKTKSEVVEKPLNLSSKDTLPLTKSKRYPAISCLKPAFYILAHALIHNCSFAQIRSHLIIFLLCTAVLEQRLKQAQNHTFRKSLPSPHCQKDYSSARQHPLARRFLSRNTEPMSLQSSKSYHS